MEQEEEEEGVEEGGGEGVVDGGGEGEEPVEELELKAPSGTLPLMFLLKKCLFFLCICKKYSFGYFFFFLFSFLLFQPITGFFV